MLSQLMEWAKRLMVLLILMNVLLNLVQKEQYGKYLRFAAGCLMSLYVISPVVSLLSSGMPERMQNVPGLILPEEQQPDMEQTLMPYYVQGMERELMNQLRACGYSVRGVRVTLEKGDVMTLSEVTILITQASEGEKLKKYLQEVYNVSEAHIHIAVIGDETRLHLHCIGTG